MNLEDDHWCFACGANNPSGLKLDFKIEGKKSRAVFVPEKRFQGYKNIIHGGIVTAALDEAMGKLAFVLGLNTVTSSLEINFKKPTVVGKTYIVYGEIVEEQEKIVKAKAELISEDGTLIAEAKGILIKIRNTDLR